MTKSAIATPAVSDLHVNTVKMDGSYGQSKSETDHWITVNEV